MDVEGRSSLRVMLLAPHPFFSERGTPMAVDLLARVLSARGCRVDLMTFAEGEDRAYPGLTIRRIQAPPGARGMRPGFSLKKLACDARLWPMARSAARGGDYDLVHAVEESAFMARSLQRRYGVPYVYDMDSSLADQLVEKMPWLKPVNPLLQALEAAAIRDALAVAPVCPALAEKAAARGARSVRLLRDISLRELYPPHPPLGWRTEQGMNGFCLLYIGNLEAYQGVDLMLEALARARRDAPSLQAAVVGGAPDAVAAYRARADRLGLGDAVRFLGPRPPAQLFALAEEADALVSPRVKGINTPMKIYSYMDAERPILATDLPTHRQALSEETAFLCAPTPDAMARAMVALASTPDRGRGRAAAAARKARAEHDFAAFARAVNGLYDEVEETIRRQGRT